jgi:hypothetical protein
MALQKKSVDKKENSVKKKVSPKQKPAAKKITKTSSGNTSVKTIEKYLNMINAKYEKIDSSIWRIEYDKIPNIIISFDPPILVVRLKLMEISETTDMPGLSKRLLELNSEQLISGAFALEDENIILVEVLQTENLDFNEFQAAIEGVSLTAVQNYKELSKYREKSENTINNNSNKNRDNFTDNNFERPSFSF